MLLLLEAWVVQLGRFDERPDQLLDVRGPLDLAQVIGLAARDRELRGEELAGVPSSAYRGARAR